MCTLDRNLWNLAIVIIADTDGLDMQRPTIFPAIYYGFVRHELASLAIEFVTA